MPRSTLDRRLCDPDEIDAAVRRADILRMTASLYEHRESISTLSLDQMPFWMNDLMGGLWMPRA